MDYDDTMTAKQYSKLIVLFILASTILYNIGANVGSDVWILYLISAFVGCLFFGIFHRLLSLHEYRSLPLIFQRCFGKVGGKILCWAYALFLLFRTKTTGAGITEVATDLLMKSAPHRMISLVLIIPVLYACFKGIRSISQSLDVMFILFTVCLLPFFVMAFVSGAFTTRHLFPIMANSVQDLWSKTVRTVVFPYMDTFIIAGYMVKVSAVEKPKILGRSIAAILYSTLVILFISLISLSILGKSLMATLKYPFYNAMMLTGITGVLERLDPLAVVLMVVCGFYKTVIILYLFFDLMSDIFPRVSRDWFIIFIFILLTVVNPSRSSLLYNPRFVLEILPIRVFPIFLAIIPIILWILTEVKVHHAKKIGKEIWWDKS